MSRLISVDTALELVEERAVSVGEETIAIDQAVGRRLSRDVVARVSAPPTDVSAMDGYAVRFEDVSTGNLPLRIVGEVPAGAPPPGPIGPGEAMRIFTGAALPSGADHILIQEETEPEANYIRAIAPQRSPQHVRKTGRDFLSGSVCLRAGTLMGPAEIGLAAAGNNDSVYVHRKKKVAVLTAGNELRPPGTLLEPGQIVDSISVSIAALVCAWGGEALHVPIARDDLISIRHSIELAQFADIIVPVGGASVGDYDLMKDAFAQAGADMVFSGVAVRPGKPTWFARFGQKSVLGLPGNPASAYVCAHLFLKVLVTGVSEPRRLFSARLSGALLAEGPRETYLRAVCKLGSNGLVVHALDDQDSSLLSPLHAANCLIRRLPKSPAAVAGEIMDCLPLQRQSGYDYIFGV